MAHERLCRGLGERTIRLTVDGEVRYLSMRGGRHVVESEGAAGVELRTDRAAIVELVEARRSLLDAVLLERLSLRGAPEELASLYDTLVVFIQGAVRSRSLPALLDAYLGSEHIAEARHDMTPGLRRTTAERG